MGPVGPRPHNQGNRAFLEPGQVHIILNGTPGIGVVPAALMHLRHIGKGIIIGLGAQTHLPPVVVKSFVAPDFQQIVFVVRRPLQRRMARFPGQPVKPFPDVLIQQCRPDGIRIVAGFRAFQGFPKSPGNLPQLKSPPIAAAAVKSAGKTAALQPHRRQMRRIQAGQGRLSMGGVGQAKSADLAVAPGLISQPFHRIVAVPPLVHILAEPPLGGIAAAAILHYRHIAVFGKETSLGQPRRGRLIVGRPLQQDRQRPAFPRGW